MDTLSSGEKLECWSSNQNESDCAWSWSNVGANIVAGVIVLILQCVVLLLYQKIFLPNVKELVERVGKKEEKIEENQRKIAVVQEELKEMISDITETWKRSGGRELMVCFI